MNRQESARLFGLIIHWMGGGDELSEFGWVYFGKAPIGDGSFAGGANHPSTWVVLEFFGAAGVILGAP